MSKIIDNGIVRDMTADEIAEYEEKSSKKPEPEPTSEERIAELEGQLKALQKLFEED